MGDIAMDWQRIEAVAERHAVCRDSGETVWRVWGKGEPIVLLHGSAGSWTHWVRNIEALAARHTVYAPDLPGFGDSDPLSAPHTFEHLATHLWAGLDELCPHRPPVVLAGFSFGSVVAENMALARNSQVRQLVLLRGNFNDRTPQPPSALLKWRHLDDQQELTRVQRHNLAVLMFHDGEKIDDQAVALHIKNSLRARMDPAVYFPSRPANALVRIDAPVCCIVGEFDCLALPEVALQSQALLAVRPDARFHLVPDAGHWAMYEAADAVNQILLDTLAPRAGRAQT